MNVQNILAICLLMLLGCDKTEIVSKEYPYFMLKEVIVSDTSASFVAEVSDEGTEDIISHGFVWGSFSLPRIGVDKSVSDSSSLSTGEFMQEINSGLVRGDKYYARPFARTRKLLVYGNQLSFIAKGSVPPVIDDFQPKSGAAGVKIKITGDNFGFPLNEISVIAGPWSLSVDSVTVNEIYTTLPQITEAGEVNVEVVAGGKSVISNDKFRILFP